MSKSINNINLALVDHVVRIDLLLIDHESLLTIEVYHRSILLYLQFFFNVVVYLNIIFKIGVNYDYPNLYGREYVYLKIIILKKNIDFKLRIKHVSTSYIDDIRYVS